MVTIFSIPKAFRENIDVIQRNAIRSWTMLHPDCELILFGDEEGTSEIANEFGIRHEPEVLKNNMGTPFTNYVFSRVQEIARNNLLCYVNCDILLMSDFSEALKRILMWNKRSFLMVGRRWDIDFNCPLDFSQPSWESHIRDLALKGAKQRAPTYIDYFVFLKKTLYYNDMPPFLVGRVCWDSWTIWRARSLRIPVVDASSAVMAVHQNHDYLHLPVGSIWKGEEAFHNIELGGEKGKIYSAQDVACAIEHSDSEPIIKKVYTINDATHVIEGDRVKPALKDEYLIKRIARLSSFVNTRVRLIRFIYTSLTRLLFAIYFRKKYFAGSLGRYFIYYLTR